MHPPEAAQGRLSGLWESFQEEYRRRLKILEGEMQAAWNDMAAQSEQVKQAYPLAAGTEWALSKLDTLERFFKDTAQSLLITPVYGRLRLKPLHRALAAMDDFSAAMEDVVRQLPVVIEVTGEEVVEAIGQAAGGRLRWSYLHLRRTARPLALRALVTDRLVKEELRRAPIDGAFQWVLARESLHLLTPWQAVRKTLLQRLSEASGEMELLTKQQQWWVRRSAENAVRARQALDRYRQWTDAVPARLALSLLGWRTKNASTRRTKRIEKLQKNFSYWSRQQRGVEALLELELDMAYVAGKATTASRSGVDSLEQEHEELLRELDGVIAWLERSAGGASGESFPPPQAKLASADDRIAVWIREISAEARSRLPLTLETVEPRGALPGWRSPWSQLEPQKTFLQALEGTGRRAAVEGMREGEAAHRAIVREIERAREVVAFGMETARTEGVTGLEVAREGVRNAIELLRYQKQNAADVRPSAEAGLVSGTAATLLETHISIEQGRLGLLAHLAREAGERGTQQLLSLLVQGLRSGLVRGGRALRELVEWALCGVGLKTPPAAVAPAVNKTERLGQILDLHVGERALPMIYRRLFRLAPVEDPRFLVGREEEMAGLMDARRQWEANRAVSVLVVGARGSGKTSLLNCAELQAFDGQRVVRGQFRERATTAAQMRTFLRDLLEMPQDENLLAALEKGRRVVMIEELERTFLRRINGFEALRDLLELVSLTWRSTLWILSLNETAFRYLDRAVGFGKFFSYRINAMAVKPRDLRSAILLRHNLSGYRLSFAPPPEGDPRVSRARRTLGLHQDPQELFFEGLYRQSEGIFRSAFELWQHYVERVEGGVMHLRQPADPDYGPLIEALTPEDYFTLQAILQHGVLTSSNHAEIFDVSEEVSRSRLERLMGLEILERDPGGVGLRVRPEAGRLVREALLQQNL